MTGSLRLAAALGGQPAGATLTINDDHLLPHCPANAGMTGEHAYRRPRSLSRSRQNEHLRPHRLRPQMNIYDHIGSAPF
ncbi:hypothetical protein EYF80_063360 [Liparis tanakae]|uniref:Uncharacterized protein n=1 Tax=Liparis tanakae TaxID=230148 RepID=A0A4Z2ECQ6_9TELE|nr:hypothetical protein EYF80_063360 [Liparis tanakae]